MEPTVERRPAHNMPVIFVNVIFIELDIGSIKKLTLYLCILSNSKTVRAVNARVENTAPAFAGKSIVCDKRVVLLIPKIKLLVSSPMYGKSSAPSKGKTEASKITI
jgi:hypothetical protein